MTGGRLVDEELCVNAEAVCALRWRLPTGGNEILVLSPSFVLLAARERERERQ